MTALRITKADIRTLTVGELELLEERTGRPLSKLFSEDAPRGVLLHCLAYIQLRRQDGSVTWEEAADAVVELDTEEEGEEAVTHTGPLARRPARPARATGGQRKR
jgi:hypothetical protein